MHKLKFVFLFVVLLAVGAFAQSLPTATLTSSNPLFAAGLGTTVAITGSTIAASGAAFVNGRARGVISVFTKPATAEWTDMTETAYLITGEVSTDLGWSVGISGDASTIVSTSQGGVYVFVKPSDGWQGNITPIAVLAQSVSTKPWIIQGEVSTVAINAKGDTIVGGAYNAGTQSHLSGGKPVAGVPDQGAVYVWAKPAGGWTDANATAKLTASDGAAYDVFGWAVGISTNTIVIGAPQNVATNGPHRGKAYLFQRPSTGVWHDSSKFSVKFTASDAMTNDVFGYSVAAGNSGALVAVGSDRGCGSSPGAAYVFAKPSPWWPSAMTQTAELTPSDGSTNTCFGVGVTVGNQQVIVGSEEALSGAGTAYTFSKPASGWSDISLPASMVGDSGSSFFGASESVNGPTTAVGAPNTPVNGNNGAGAIYLFSN